MLDIGVIYCSCLEILTLLRRSFRPELSEVVNGLGSGGGSSSFIRGFLGRMDQWVPELVPGNELPSGWILIVLEGG